jgi:hypothetical protein
MDIINQYLCKSGTYLLEIFDDTLDITLYYQSLRANSKLD